MMIWASRLLARFEAATSGYFHTIGWFESRATGRALDARGNAIPWFSYPAIVLLESRVRRELRVLEFGSGMGTIWWSERVTEHIAIEHDAGWADMITAQSRATIHRSHGDTPEAYLAPVHALGKFDVVVVDGLHRNECLTAALSLLTPDGVVILDDAQRKEYAFGIDALRAQGFRMLPLAGPQPVSKHAGCTAIFYRRENVLDL